MVSLTNFRSVSELNTATNLHSTNQTNANEQLYQRQNDLPTFGQQQPDQNKYYFNQLATIEDKPLKRNSSSLNKEHFEIRWNNLTYEVEPKWYRRKWKALTGGGSSSDDDNNNTSNQGPTIVGAQPQSTMRPRSKSSKTSILDNLNGSVKSGQVTAILGPSGAGKTSLLGCLTGKNKSGVSGCVQVISARNEPMSICTIPQKGKCKQ